MYKKICGLLMSVLWLGVSPAVAFCQTSDVPSRITYFYNEARIEVQRQAKPQSLSGSEHGFFLFLPDAAKEESLQVSVNGKSPSGIEFLNSTQAREQYGIELELGLDPAQEKDAKRQAQLQTLQDLLMQQGLLQGELEGLQNSKKLWGQGLPDASPVNAEEFGRFVSTQQEQLPKLGQELVRVQNALSAVARQIEQAQNALSQADSVRQLRLVVVKTSQAQQAMDVRYSYLLPAQSRPTYRLNAIPEKNVVQLEQSISLTLPNAGNWPETPTFLALVNRYGQIAPSELLPWYIEEASDKLNKSTSAQYARSAAIAGQALSMGEMDMLSAPHTLAEEMSTFRLWDLGLRPISATARHIVLLQEDIPADFYYTIRPVQNSLGYLTADLRFNTPPEFPLGQAVFSVDGYFTGNAHFQASKEITQVFFGPDPLVYVQKMDMNKDKDKQGWINNQYVYSWNWELMVFNQRTRAITLRVEDSLPLVEDKDFKLTMESTPKPKEVTRDTSGTLVKYLLWEQELAPQGRFKVSHTVKLVGPRAINSMR